MLTARLFSTPEADAALSDAAALAAMLRFEAALAQVQAEAGVIPEAAAQAIAAACDPALYDTAALVEATALAGNPAIPLVKALTAAVAEHDAETARHVHRGATSQDVIDTARMLQAREALIHVAADVGRLEAALDALTRRHRDTPMAGRTLLQVASPITFGLKTAGWLESVRHARGRLIDAQADALRLQFGGAVGTLGVLGDTGPAVAQALAHRLELAPATLPWHARRERIAGLGAAIGILIGVLGKIALDISLMMQTEVAEAFEPAAEGKGGSSAMPHKRNPVACVAALAAAKRAPGLVGTLLTCLPQEHERAVGGWHAEWDTLNDLLRLLAGSARQMAACCEGLEVDAERMGVNLMASGGVALSEAAAAALSEALGRTEAARIVEAASRRAAGGEGSLHDLLAADPQVAAAVPAEALAVATNAARALGSAQTFIDAVLDDHD